MKNRSVLLLMEQAILLVVFALAAAVCLRLFVWADGASKQDAQRDYALFQAQNAAEEIKTAGGDLEKAAQSYGGSVSQGLWRLPLEEGCCLQAALENSENPYLGQARVQVLGAKGDILAEITVRWQEDGP